MIWRRVDTKRLVKVLMSWEGGGGFQGSSLGWPHLGVQRSLCYRHFGGGNRGRPGNTGISARAGRHIHQSHSAYKVRAAFAEPPLCDLLRMFWESVALCLWVLLLSQLQVAEGCLGLGHLSGKEEDTGFKPGFLLWLQPCPPVQPQGPGLTGCTAASLREAVAVTVPHAG